MKMAKTEARSVKISTGHYADLAEFRFALRTFMAFSESAAEDRGLTAQQHQAILAIQGLGSKDDATVGDLAHYLLLKPHTAGELVERLVKAKLVVRKPDQSDRRRVLLALTPKAITTLKILSAKHLAEIRRNAPTLIKLLRQLSKK
jgi:DNA-binding MarR family transcriptional regulator